MWRKFLRNWGLSGADAATPPCRPPRSSYTPVTALSTVSSVAGAVAATPSLKGPVAPHPGPPWRVSRVVWTSETLSRSRGWSSYTCECRAAL